MVERIVEKFAAKSNRDKALVAGLGIGLFSMAWSGKLLGNGEYESGLQKLMGGLTTISVGALFLHRASIQDKEKEESRQTMHTLSEKINELEQKQAELEFVILNHGIEIKLPTSTLQPIVPSENELPD